MILGKKLYMVLAQCGFFPGKLKNVVTEDRMYYRVNVSWWCCKILSSDCRQSIVNLISISCFFFVKKFHAISKTKEHNILIYWFVLLSFLLAIDLFYIYTKSRPTILNKIPYFLVILICLHTKGGSDKKPPKDIRNVNTHTHTTKIHYYFIFGFKMNSTQHQKGAKLNLI